MKTLLRIFIIFCVGCASAKKVNAPYIETNIYDAKIEKSQTDSIARTLSEFPDNSEIAIAIINSKQVDYYGLQRKNDSIKRVHNSNSVFEIGSITKVFTTHLLLNLLNENKIKNLDESILPYLDFSIKGRPLITFRQLANHTSGLPADLAGSIFNTDPANPYKNWDKEKLVEYFEKDLKLASKPGEKYQYSNIGMALLAYAICNIESKDFESLLQEKILRPILMENTTTKRDWVADSLIQGYNWKGKPTANWDMAEMKGAGALLSTVHDLSKYLLWTFKATNSQLAFMKEPTRVINENVDIALGWHIIKNETREPFLWHNGGTGGYKSSMGINLNNQTGIIILTNIGATGNPKKKLIDDLCFDLMKSLDK